ncbi:unnamed protein product [Anisakis simplex]|uniref:Uncharacterized protein n=1 Tax=Anisakis simplex TaxID=6269 RepID=A0A0M3J6L3_ANISI|nr:unnamed protein product [Anisakis simplex]
MLRPKAFFFSADPKGRRLSVKPFADIQLLQHRFHHDHNSSQRQSSNSGLPLLKKKLAGYTDEELYEYRQVFNMFDTGSIHSLFSPPKKYVYEDLKQAFDLIFVTI